MIAASGHPHRPLKASSLSSPSARGPTSKPTAVTQLPAHVWIEVCLGLSILGLLLALALPTLRATAQPRPVDRAAAYLKALSQVLERGYQNHQRYPQITRKTLPELTPWEAQVGDLHPEPHYRYELSSEAQAYTLTAAAQKGLRCVLTLNQSQIRTAIGPDCGKVSW